jgi:predicted RecB family nuclease
VFNDWAWRIPFLFSFLLVFVTMYMRANFEESPVYAEIKAKGQTSKNPWREAFLDPVNLKYVVIATIVVLGEGVTGTAASSGRCSTCRRFPRWTRSPAP